jgi:lipopolysaccharide transport system ATP-binding protein
MQVVALERVGKAFRSYSSRWARLREWLDPRALDCHEKTWVLRDVSFFSRRARPWG